ncbi:MAG: carbamoyl-phosphate synthase large subunit, partial [Proteobacteria bacterium]|nr:carbamoyl-phosphate synthase large subunit [Pseudomonadota bacterium]
MPKRPDIHSVLIIGAGPIVIGQACEFDYSGTQACKALREEGLRVILVNSNPATIMTDPEFADRTYIEPITPECIEKIIAREIAEMKRSGAEGKLVLLPTLGGQTALNTAMALHRRGGLERFGVEMIGANARAIERGEDRQIFKEAMVRIGLDVPQSGTAHTIEEARAVAERIGRMPLIIRPAYTLGGTGGGIAYNREEFEELAKRGMDLSPVTEILVEESLIGWKEFEMEVMRDRADNCVVICSIENLDPMGIHTGDSITVAPIQTLTDKEYQIMRDASFAVIREIGVETGGSNIQFAVNPENGRMVIIEMNPRVSRSSALASKATGFPIAKIAAKLAVGYLLNEIKNDITRETPACFEPTIDYVVTKVPRFAFEKFPQADPVLNTAMKSVGEAMAIGRNFKEALQKGIRSLEISRYGFGFDGKDIDPESLDQVKLREKLIVPNAERFFYIKTALEKGMSVEEISNLSKIDRWFVYQMKEIVDLAKEVGTHRGKELKSVPREILHRAKRDGFSDIQLAYLLGRKEEEIFQLRQELEIRPVYKLLDTCAGEFHAEHPYFYSSYDKNDESRASGKPKVIVLGGGPNRIGQGIEFDYCCVHASYAIQELGYESIIINSNPETVSTDYDTSTRLYFEPLTREDVLAVVAAEKPFGVIVQLGGQTPLNLAVPLEKAGVKILGTTPDSIDRAEDRERFRALLKKLKLLQTPNASAFSFEEAKGIAKEIGYPVIVRPSYVLGGRAMEIVYDDKELEKFMQLAIKVTPEHPVLVDKFLDDAIEVDVDAIADGETVVIGGIMEHIEEAGVHSGDAAMSLPPYSLGRKIVNQIREQTIALALELQVKGLMNVQFAVKDNLIYILEVNPRASRTVPFISKAVGVSLANLATKVMCGQTLKELN